MPQESHLSKLKLELIEFGHQLMLSQGLENDPQVTLVILLILGEDQDIIHKNHNEHIQVGLEHPMHKIHECCWSIRHSEWYHCELKMPISRSKHRLRDIFLRNSQLMVAGADIYLRVDPRPSQLIKQIINLRQREPILDSSPIQLPVIYTQSKSLVPLLGK